MYVGLKQPRGDGERYVTQARAAAKETNPTHARGTIVRADLHGTTSSQVRKAYNKLTTALRHRKRVVGLIYKKQLMS